MTKKPTFEDKRKEEFWECVGFGAHKVELPDFPSAEERNARNRAMLARVLARGDVIAMVGNGCSRPLGYPGWDGFVNELLENTAKIATKQDEDRLGKMHASVKDQRLKPETKKYFLDACQKYLADNGKLDKYKVILKKFFDPGEAITTKKRDTISSNPYESLVALPITRFMTTNYDTEIELILQIKRGTHPNVFGLLTEKQTEEKEEGKTIKLPPKEKWQSFTQLPEYREQHVRFFLSREKSNRDMVFHVHGRWDDPESVVAGEGDYQQWYLSEREEGGEILTQKIDLMISSNPLLFIGYGFGDEELMRILRRVCALDPGRKHSRPLFALMPWDEEKDPYKPDFLYERFGLNVITFAVISKPKKKKSIKCKHCGVFNCASCGPVSCKKCKEINKADFDKSETNY